MNKKIDLFGILQKIGKAFMFPIALLPVAGLLLGLGASFTNPQMINSFHLDWLLNESSFLYFILIILKDTGSIIFANLPIFFAMGIALGFAKKEKAAATLSSAIAYLVFNQTISSLLKLTGKLNSDKILEGAIGTTCGIQTLQMGVFGGILVGFAVALLHNKFYKIKLPDMLSFFGGIRFVPIVSCFFHIFIGILMFFIWPHIQTGIYLLGNLVSNTGYIGTFVYGIIERSLIPFGLHPVFYMPFWQTGVGGTAMIDGSYISGAQNIFFAELASPNTIRFDINAARFMAGKFPFMMFGLPAAALAMYSVAKANKKTIVKGLLLSAALTALLTGITEPIEFTFLFVAPVLYVIHCVLAGLSFMIMHMFNIPIGQTFSGGLIDFLLFGILQGNDKTNWLRMIPVGILYFILYYFLFKYLIKKFNFITPGREEDTVKTKLYTKKDIVNLKNKNNMSEIIVLGLGGVENILDLDCCATRLRIAVADELKVNDEILKQTNYSGILKNGKSIQIIYGPKVSVIKTEVDEYISELN
ncbi:MAG: PTS transporter subunit EIIC [Candidatus Paraimprobicoccus trichonymphae]|uniref:PTS transporter subunit EIIC n=1 Tax=Candidatus Paraimprobicoccus trichonymphae TaxID=3033793 RepID=A0AA48KZ40_9FIRM|nr:MAG: PTS transporter subunit EIIC [Candidatus Paraimprobicoccus trichonymphae]